MIPILMFQELIESKNKNALNQTFIINLYSFCWLNHQIDIAG